MIGSVRILLLVSRFLHFSIKLFNMVLIRKQACCVVVTLLVLGSSEGILAGEGGRADGLGGGGEGVTTGDDP